MKRRKRIEITVETRQLLIRRNTNEHPVWCSVCASPVRLIEAEDAAALAGVSTRAIYRLADRRQLHFVETLTGKLLVCPNFLPLAFSVSEEER